MKMEQCSETSAYKFRRRGFTQKKAYNMVSVTSQCCFCAVVIVVLVLSLLVFLVDGILGIYVPGCCYFRGFHCVFVFTFLHRPAW